MSSTNIVRSWEERLGIRLPARAEIGPVEAAVLELAQTTVDEIPQRLLQLAIEVVPASVVGFASPQFRVTRSRDGSEPVLPPGFGWCSERRGTLCDRDAPFIGPAQREYVISACDEGWLAVAGDQLNISRALAFAKMAGAIWMKVRAEAISGEEATRDGLTGLLNERGLYDAIARLPRGTAYAVLYGDLDGLKAMNDSQGHAAGDALLKSTASVIQSAVRSGDLVSRLHGDEFIVVSIGDQPDQVMGRLRSALKRARIEMSWGGARVPEEAEQPEAALALADERMFADKKSRGGGRR